MLQRPPEIMPAKWRCVFLSRSIFTIRLISLGLESGRNWHTCCIIAAKRKSKFCLRPGPLFSHLNLSPTRRDLILIRIGIPLPAHLLRLGTIRVHIIHRSLNTCFSSSLNLFPQLKCGMVLPNPSETNNIMTRIWKYFLCGAGARLKVVTNGHCTISIDLWVLEVGLCYIKSIIVRLH